jgi:hypothetical protein
MSNRKFSQQKSFQARWDNSIREERRNEGLNSFGCDALIPFDPLLSMPPPTPSYSNSDLKRKKMSCKGTLLPSYFHSLCLDMCSFAHI